MSTRDAGVSERLAFVSRRRPPECAIVTTDLATVALVTSDMPVRVVSDDATRTQLIQMLATPSTTKTRFVVFADTATAGYYAVRALPLYGGSRSYVMLVIEPLASRAGIADARERYNLAPRETEVLRYLVSGESGGSIAAKLGIAETTVQDTVGRIGAKMRVKSRKAIVARALGLERATD